MKRPPFDPSLEQALADMSRRIEEGRNASAAKPAGSISVPNGDGTRTLLGVAAGTSGVAPWVGDTTAPGRPTGLSAVSHSGTVLARWDGTLEGGIPADFHHVEISASFGGTTLDLGSLTAAGELPSGVIPAGTVVTVTAVALDDAHAQDGTPAPNVSPASDPVQVTVESSVDPAIVEQLSDQLATAQQTLDQAQTDIDSAQQAASDAATQAATAVASASAASQQADAAKASADAAVVTTVQEYATSAGATAAPTSGWSATAPQWVAGTYIWVRTTITFGDGHSEQTSPLVVTGNPGTPGTPGTDGRGVSSTKITYQPSESGTTAPTGTWSSSVPAVPAGQFLWTRTVTTFTDSTTTTSYSVGRMGTNGSDGTPGAPGSDGATTYLHVAYSTAADGSSGFSTTNPSGATYLGTYTDTTAADSSSPSAYEWVLIKGTAGTPGNPGKGISSSTVTWQGSTSGTTAPTGTWAATIPTVAAGSYLWTRTVITFTDGAKTTAYSVAAMGKAGSAGVSVTSVVRWFQTGTTPPAVPATSPPPAPWSKTEPGYVAGVSLYYVDLVTYSNSTWACSAVQLSSSYTAASQALTVANLAQAAAQGLVSASVDAPAEPPSGAIWFPLDASGRVIGMKLYNGTAWTSYTLMADQLLVPGSVGTVSIADGKITTPKLASDVLDVKNFTATGTSTLAEAVAQSIWAGIVNAQVANIQDLHATTGAIDSAVIGKLAAQIITSKQFWTALTGARVGMDGSGIHAFNSAGVGTFDLTGDTGNIQGATVQGSSIQGSTFDLIGAAGEAGIVDFVAEGFSAAAKTANAVTGETSSSDEYSGFSVRSTTAGAVLTGSVQASGGRAGGDLKFTVARSGADWVWLAYAPPSSVSSAIPGRGTKTLVVWVKASAVQPAANLVAGYVSVDDGTPGRFQGDHVILDAGVWTPLTATIPPDVSLSWLSINLPGSPDDTPLAVEVDDLTVSGASNNGSTLRIGYDANGNAGLVMYDQNGDKTVNINGFANRITGDLIAGNAHLASWSDGSGNTRSGLLLDDAAGTKDNETDSVTTPRLISNKDSSGNVDTFISTGINPSTSAQSLVRASQSMNKASIESADATHHSSLSVTPTSIEAACLDPTSVLGDTGWIFDGIIWGNGFIPYAGSGFDGVRYRVKNGWCVVAGAITRDSAHGNSWAAGDVPCSIPSPYRPQFIVRGNNATIQPGGNIQLQNGGSGATDFSAIWPIL